MSFPTCLYIKDVLDLLSDKVKPQNWFLRLLGSVVSMFTFRRRAQLHLIMLVIGLVLLVGVSWLWEEVFKVVLGGVLVEVIHLGGEAFMFLTGERRSEES